MEQPDPLTPRPSERQTEFRRWLAIAVSTGAIYLWLCWYPQGMTMLGVSNLGVWFMDTRAVLAASDAAAAGLDPLAPNPFDLLQQPHVYSDWWFALGWWGLTRADHVWIGGLLGLTFLVVALLQTRARTWTEVGCTFAALVSPPFLFGFNRGNADLLLFIVLSATVPCLLAQRSPLRWLALVPLLLAANLKYYPLAGALVLLASHRPRREMLFQLTVFVILLALLAWQQMAGLQRYTSDEHTPAGFFTFGAGTAALLLGFAPGTGIAIAGMVCVAIAIVVWRAAPHWRFTADRPSEHLRFILGAVLLAGCYVMTINFAYRAVFSIWMVPLLWAAWRASDWPPYFRRLGRITGMLLLAWLWFDGCACLILNLSDLPEGKIAEWTQIVTLVEQPLVAALMIGLLGFLVPFARDGLSHLAGSKVTAPALASAPSRMS